MIEIREGLLLNLDTVRTVQKNNAKNGGDPFLMVSYIDTVSIPTVFDSKGNHSDNHVDMCNAYNKIKNSNKK